MAETEPIFEKQSADAVQHDPIFEENHKTKTMKVIVGIFLGITAVFIALSVIMVSIQSWRRSTIFILLLVNILACSQILVFTVFFIYSGRLAKNCIWAIFLVGLFVIAQSINYDIVAFTA